MKLSEQMFRCGIFTSLRQVYKWAAEVVKLENKSDDEQGLRYKTQNETSKRIHQLEAELAMYERDETFGTLAIRVIELEAEKDALKKENLAVYKKVDELDALRP